jgi:hypothetical protein
MPEKPICSSLSAGDGPLRATLSGGVLRAYYCPGTAVHETQDRGDFCGRYCWLQHIRDEVFRKLDEASSGWNAVAVGAAGGPGLSLKAATEQAAVNEALANCVKSDSDCHVVAIGPFSVGPN